MNDDRTNQIVYGINPAFEIIRAKRRGVRVAYISDQSSRNPRLRKLESVLADRDIQIRKHSKHSLFSLSGSKENQGIVLQCDPYPFVEIEQQWTKNRLLLIDNVEDPQNVGAIMRSAELLGFQGVLVPNKGVPGVYPSVIKASAGATEFLDITQCMPANRYAIQARDAGFTILALDAKGKTPLDQVSVAPDEKILLVIGGEDQGVGQYILNTAQEVVSIPLQGRVNSLNASVAAALAMYHLRPVGAA